VSTRRKITVVQTTKKEASPPRRTASVSATRKPTESNSRKQKVIRALRKLHPMD
jgi:hypothetical protein